MTRLGAGARSILSNASYLFGSHIATTLTRGVYVVVLARALGPEAFGAFNYSQAWYLAFIALTYLGLDTYLVQRVGAARAKAAEALHETLVVRSVAAVIVASAMLLAALLVEDDPSLRGLIAIFSIALVGRTIWLWAVSAFTAFEATHFALRWDAVFRPAEVIAGLIILTVRPDLQWLAAMHAVLWCLQGWLGLRTVTNRLSPLRNGTSLPGAFALLRRALPAAMYPIVIAQFMQAPIMIVRLMESDEFAFGQFVLAYQVFVYFLVVPYLFSTVMLPVVSRAALRGDGTDVGHVALLVRISLVAGAALMVFLAPAIPALTVAVFGAIYEQAGAVLGLLMWVALPFAAVTFLLQLFFARSAYLPVCIYGCCGAAIMTLALPFGAPNAIEVSVVAAVGAGAAVWFIATLIATVRYVPSYGRWRSAAALAAAVATAIAYALAVGLAPWLRITVSLGVLIAAAIGFRAIGRADLEMLVTLTALARDRRRAPGELR